MIRIARRTASVALATALITAGTVGVASANAPGGNETCPANRFCVYYNSWQYGWGAFEPYQFAFEASMNDGTQFLDAGNGSGVDDPVYHNVAAFVNNTSGTWEMCTDNKNYCERYTPGEAGNVSPDIHNENGYIDSYI